MGSRTLPWLVPLVLLLGCIVLIPAAVFEENGLPRYQALKDQLRELHTQNDALEADVRRLTIEVEQLRSSPIALERVARDELGLVRPGELVFQFPAKATTLRTPM